MENKRTKRCKKCGELKEFLFFPKQTSKLDGIGSCCRKCSAIAQKSWREKNKESRKEKQKIYHLNNKEKRNLRKRKLYKLNHKPVKNKTNYKTSEKTRISIKRYQENNKEKLLSRQTMANAIKSGKIKRCPCSFCGKENAEGHHEYYFKPLQIIWLCRLCHKKYHSGKIKLK